MKNSRTKNKESQWFGYKKVKEQEKYNLVDNVFTSVADNYDLMNDLMSACMHRLWKHQLIKMIKPSAKKSLLDVAGGTGDISFLYKEKAGTTADITICDINPNMLNVGKNRAIDKGFLPKDFNWIEGNAEKLPFEDNSFDIYTISFGLRNVPKIDNALEEAYRVLKSGGKFFCMEFSKVNNPLLDKIYEQHLFKIIPTIGEYVANDRESYQYLSESIRQFPSQTELAERIEKAGFKLVSYTNLTGGIVAIHKGVKL